MLETAGKQSPQKANVPENIEHQNIEREILSRVCHHLSGALQTAQTSVSLNNVVNVAVPHASFSADSPVRSVNSFIPDIRGGGEILKETNRVKRG